MKKLMLLGSVGMLVLLVAVPAKAELCGKCKGNMLIMSIGKCVECGAQTGSGAKKLCPTCSGKMGECEVCRARLKGAAEPGPKDTGAPAAPRTIDTTMSATYTSGKWTYKYRITAKGTRSQGRWGELSFAGKRMPEPANVNDHYETPWGKIFWVGPGNFRWGLHRWMPQPRGHKAMGKLLPAPVSLAVAPLKLDDGHHGRTVPAIVGQTIIIRLKGNASTGHTWRPAKLTGRSVRLIGGPTYEQGAAAVGAGGVFLFTYEAIRTGKAKIHLEYRRPSEKNKPPAKIFTVNVDVQANPTGERVKMLKEAVDKFQLHLRYYGPQDKPYYALTLRVPQVKDRRSPFWPAAQLTKDQAGKIIDHLAADGFLARAGNIATKHIKVPAGPAYTMTVLGPSGTELYEVLGWELPMLQRLDALRKVLDGDPARQMDLLLGRMSGHRRQWQRAAGGGQGVAGKVEKLKGNFMPGVVGPGIGIGRRGQKTPLSVPVHVFRGKVKAFKKPDRNHAALVKVVRSDKDGVFKVELPTGEYTVVAEIDGKLYLNHFTGSGHWATATVRQGQWTTFNIEDTSQAAF